MRIWGGKYPACRRASCSIIIQRWFNHTAVYNEFSRQAFMVKKIINVRNNNGKKHFKTCSINQKGVSRLKRTPRQSSFAILTLMILAFLIPLASSPYSLAQFFSTIH